MKHRMNLCVPPSEAKLPPARYSARHPNPKFRPTRENQHFGTVDSDGRYHGPKGGYIPTAPPQDTEAPARTRALAHERWLKRQQRGG